MNWRDYMVPFITLIIVFGAGMIVRQIMLAYLKKITEKTETKIDDIIIDAIKQPFILWCFVFGLSISIKMSTLADKHSALADKIMFSLLIVSVTMVVSKIVSGIIEEYIAGREGMPKMSSLTQNAARWVIYLVGILVLLNHLEVSITPILTALGVGGLAVALALQDTLSNLFAGFHITFSKQIQVGDYVKLENGYEGFVFDIGWRNTRIKELSNNIVIVPNSKLSQAIVKNYCMPQKDMSVVIPVGVDYSSDLDKVEKVTIEVAKEVLNNFKGAAHDFEPFIRYNAFSESSINFSVILKANEFTDKFVITHEFIKKLKARYEKEKIIIPFPARTVYLKNNS